VVVTYAILGALVGELAGDAADVRVMVPNGLDPHEWEPSARDVETLTHAAFVVENGLGLEGGMEKALAAARAAGVPFFTASSAITPRRVGAGEGVPTGDPDQAEGAEDPHLWTDPLTVERVMDALAPRLGAVLGTDLSPRRAALDAALEGLDAEVRAMVDGVPAASRRLVTGHESLGYFAERYGFTLVGAIVPGLSTQSGVSAAQVAALARALQGSPVRIVFTELGTPRAVAEALARQLGSRIVPLATHVLPADGSYATFMRDLARTITGNLRGEAQ
jgi:zinc/manganese transport system substrate-binding protein